VSSVQEKCIGVIWMYKDDAHGGSLSNPSLALAFRVVTQLMAVNGVVVGVVIANDARKDAKCGGTNHEFNFLLHETARRAA